jgi:phosphatidylglycerol---prolipoprotein diacylglyceryl transferase
MPGPFVHRLDPVIAEVGGVYLWWYGLSYTLGFLQIYAFLFRRRVELSLSRREVMLLSLLISVMVLVGGRTVEVLFDEWAFYREHLSLIPALWLGGMATHGLLLGALAGATIFSFAARKPFIPLADALVIPGAILMGVGRLGNFIDGQIVGRVTDVSWAVQFPDADGFRHPIVLYDGLKNLLLVPYLLYVRRTNPTPGATASRFVFWYAFLRIFVDLFRDYPTHRIPIGTGQLLNLVMAAVGAGLLYRSRLRRLGRLHSPAWQSAGRTDDRRAGWGLRLAFAAVLLFSLAIPSNWTQDVPARYGKRHPGLTHSWLYPAIDTRAPSVKKGQGTNDE